MISRPAPRLTTRLPTSLLNLDHRLSAPEVILCHRAGQRCRFRVDPTILPALLGDHRVWNDVLFHRWNGWNQSLIVHFAPGADPLAWADQHATVAIAPALAPPPQPSDSVQSALDASRLELLPPRLRLPLMALVATVVAVPLGAPVAPLMVLVFLAAGRCFARAGDSLINQRRLNVDVLDALAVVLHSIEGFLLGPALMLTMIEGGESIRDATARIAHASARSLKADLTRPVRLRRGTETITCPLAEVQLGDVVLVFAGDQVLVDGQVVLGQASLDVRSLTGESVPRYAEVGDDVLASSVMLEGSLEIKATAVGDHTRSGQIVQMIQQAPICDSRVGNYAARVADRFVLPTLGLATLSYAISANLSQAASLLMLDLGTGLRVSVPTAILASLNHSAGTGVLIRSGRALEALADVDVVVFDKTGTLTTGEPELLQITPLDSRYTANKLLQLAASIEQGLQHPIAIAITAAAQHKRLALLPIGDWQCLIGRGVAATHKGRQVFVGNRRLLREQGIDPPPRPTDHRLRVATEVLVAVDGRLVGVLYVADQLRPESIALLKALKEQGIDSHLLTGDAESVALQVGHDLGLDRSRIHAEALPDLKAEVVRRLRAEGRRVAFVGDGLNDSAALAYAEVAVSFQHGSDLARETADIVLCGDKITQLLDAHALARFSMGVVRQNIALVAVPNLTALVLGVIFPIPPLLAILINNGSCIMAALNALRPLRFSPPAVPQALAMPTPLGHSQLAQRLGISVQQLVARRSRADFPHWSSDRDPQTLSWRYDPHRRHYKLGDAVPAAHDAT